MVKNVQDRGWLPVGLSLPQGPASHMVEPAEQFGSARGLLLNACFTQISLGFSRKCKIMHH